MGVCVPETASTKLPSMKSLVNLTSTRGTSNPSLPPPLPFAAPAIVAAPRLPPQTYNSELGTATAREDRGGERGGGTYGSRTLPRPRGVFKGQDESRAP